MSYFYYKLIFFTLTCFTKVQTSFISYPDNIVYRGEYQSLAWSNKDTYNLTIIDLYQNNNYLYNLDKGRFKYNIYNWLIPNNQKLGDNYQIKLTFVNNYTKYYIYTPNFYISDINFNYNYNMFNLGVFLFFILICICGWTCWCKNNNEDRRFNTDFNPGTNYPRTNYPLNDSPGTNYPLHGNPMRNYPLHGNPMRNYPLQGNAFISSNPIINTQPGTKILPDKSNSCLKEKNKQANI